MSKCIALQRHNLSTEIRQSLRSQTPAAGICKHPLRGETAVARKSLRHGSRHLPRVRGLLRRRGERPLYKVRARFPRRALRCLFCSRAMVPRAPSVIVTPDLATGVRFPPGAFPSPRARRPRCLKLHSLCTPLPSLSMFPFLGGIGYGRRGVLATEPGRAAPEPPSPHPLLGTRCLGETLV